MELSPVLTMIFGALLIGIGGHLSAITPKLWQGMIIKSNPRILAVILGLLGIALVGGGGTLTTYSWNEIDRADEKKAIIISVANEWYYNQYLYKKSTLFTEDPVSLRSYNFYPRFSNEKIRIALMSSLFSLSDSLDHSLLSILAKMERIIYKTNNRLQVTDDYSKTTTDRDSVADRRSYALKSTGLELFTNNQEILGEFIKSSYPWALPDSAFVAMLEEM